MTNGATDGKREILLAETQSSRASASEMLKWTLGSLLVINGGALVALLAEDSTRNVLFGLGGWLFVGGIALDLVGGGLFFYYFDVRASNIDDALWPGRELGASRYTAVRMSRATQIAAVAGLVFWIASFAAFVAGCLVVSSHFSAAASSTSDTVKVPVHREEARTKPQSEKRLALLGSA